MDPAKQLLILLLLKKKKMLLKKQILCSERLHTPRRRKRFGVREIFRNRQAQGDGHHLLAEMRLTDPEYFFNYTRMDVEGFENLLALVGPSLKKREMTTAIVPAQRLALTLRYLATGNSMVDVGLSYRCHKSTVSIIIRETLTAICDVVGKTYLKPPRTPQEWLELASLFEEQWQMPHCVGAVDGKHIVIQAFAGSGSMHYCSYKGFFSIILMALVDADYNFLIVDVGAAGSAGDGGVFADSALGKYLHNRLLNLPEPSEPPGADFDMPYYLVGDAAFPLHENLMKPYGGKHASYEQRIFDYRLSRARRVVENAFGILAARWRIFRRPIHAEPETVDKIVTGAVVLHNYINKARVGLWRQYYCPPGFVDRDEQRGNAMELVPGTWRLHVTADGAVQPGPRYQGRNATKDRFALRNKIKDYLNNIYTVPWQDDSLKQGFWGCNLSV